MHEFKGARLFVNLGASQTRRRLKGFGHGVRQVQTAGTGRAVIVHTATGQHLRELEAKFADVGYSETELGLGTLVDLVEEPEPTSVTETNAKISIMNLDLRHGANAKVLAAFAKPNEPLVASPDSGKDPYYERGSHPEIVERIWDQIGKSFPPAARCLIYGNPALVDPETGLIIAVGYGTAYCVRIPVGSLPEAIHLGARLSMKWSNGETTNIQDEFGEGWVFGAWLTQETAWCQQSCQGIGRDS